MPLPGQAYFPRSKTMTKTCSRRDKPGVSEGMPDAQTAKLSYPLESVPDELVAALKERRVILFAGAGLSMSVGLPSWQRFIDHLCHELGLDINSTLGPDTSYHSLAEYYRIKKGSIGPLRSWLDRNWKVSESEIRDSKIHASVVELEFPIIYTTNYDRNLEVAFQIHGRNFVKVANARDIANIRDGITQIVKFHGDFDEDES